VPPPQSTYPLPSPVPPAPPGNSPVPWPATTSPSGWAAPGPTDRTTPTPGSFGTFGVAPAPQPYGGVAFAPAELAEEHGAAPPRSRALLVVAIIVVAVGLAALATVALTQ
jgi:hypothetical protein